MGDWVNVETVKFYLNCFFAVRLNLIFIILGMYDMRARGYKVIVQNGF